LARTQAPEYEARREVIVERAAELFARTGFHAASVADLAKACEYSKSLIYYYFPSKEDVLFAVMESHVDILLADVAHASRQELKPGKKLALLVRTFMGHYAGAASRQKVLLNELDSLPEDKRAQIVGKQRQIIDAVQVLLVAQRPELAADPARARGQTMLLFGTINWTHTWFDPAGALSSEDIADMVIELFEL
jgi:AcrR family transcriptional regulator